MGMFSSHIAEADKNSTAFFSGGNCQNKTSEMGVVTSVFYWQHSSLRRQMIKLFTDVTTFTCITSYIHVVKQLDPNVTLTSKCISLAQKLPKQCLISVSLKKKKKIHTDWNWVLNLTFLIHENGWKCHHVHVTRGLDVAQTFCSVFLLRSQADNRYLLFQSD